MKKSRKTEPVIPKRPKALKPKAPKPKAPRPTALESRSMPALADVSAPWLVISKLFTHSVKFVFVALVVLAIIVIAALVFVRPTGNVSANVDISTRRV